MRTATATVIRPKTLFDRTDEWEALVAFAGDARPGPAVGMVTGPRGQGKTHLLQEFVRATGGFYFGGPEAVEAESLRRLSDELAHHAGEGPPVRWQGWGDALDALLALGADRPVPIVLDGFPELVRQSPALPAAVVAACHRLRSGNRPNRARLLLCGSAMSVMCRLLGSASTAIDFQLEVRRLDHRQGALLWGLDDPVLALLVHAVVGSSPVFRYDAAGEDTPLHRDEFDSWVCRTVLNPRLPLFWRAGHVIEREPDGWDRALCHSTVTAVADGCSTAGAIADRLAHPATDILRVLTRLSESGLVAGLPDAFRPGVTHHRIAEPLLAFDHTVIRPHHDALERREATQVWRSARAAFHSSTLERHFAQVCREWAFGCAAPDTFGAAPAAVSPGTVPVARGLGPSVADVVVRGAAGAAHSRRQALLSVGLARWNETLDLPHLHEVQRIVATLAELGEDVSRTRPALYGAAGFSARLRSAEAHGELILVDLPRLYVGA
ncbi:ArsR family transcriptional regulator [Kitasatospora sp. NPDC004669]|uniref:AAA family ATPase n=1 Tax=Kitasatospora sp. NPDC004669 TaxID=3154555 RepID=UPI0033B0D25C